MSRSVSTFAVAIILFVAFLATFSSAAPADVARGELGVQRRHNHVKDTPSQVDNTTDSTTSTDTTVTDDTNSGSSSGTYTGQATYFTPGLGACGEYNTAGDSIVALASANYAQSYCDKQVRITNLQTGESTTATVRDECPGCGYGSLDMSPTTFQATGADLSEGVYPISWYFL